MPRDSDSNISALASDLLRRSRIADLREDSNATAALIAEFVDEPLKALRAEVEALRAEVAALRGRDAR